VVKGRTLLVGGAGLALALALKEFYSHAGADQLLWILAPSAWVARYLGGVDLTYERGAGFISSTHHLVVGPACAGVNFLVIAFLTLFFAFLSRFEGVRRRLDWMAGALAIAYGATIITNGVRIVLAAHLYELPIYHGSVTPELVHRLAGTVIYYGSLLALHQVVGALLNARARRLVPLGCYLLVTIGVPLATRSFDDPRQFVEHVTWVVAVAAALTLLVVLLSFLRRRAAGHRMPGDGLQWRT
jgi:exosortase K